MSAGWHGRILIVEDSELNSILVRLIAEQLGWKCDWCESVERLEKLLSTEYSKYDFVLLDQHLDAQKGGKWLKSYFDAHPTCNMPFIGISAQFFEYDVHDLIRAGISGIFPKPITRENLESIQNTLQNKQLYGFQAGYFNAMFGNSILIAQSFKVFLHRLLEFKNESIHEYQQGHWNRSLGIPYDSLNSEGFNAELQRIISGLSKAD
ncbi:MAG: response regulator [Bacteroidetes bacterium]|jgi:DNA-binding response OmpR family regulator|nr:response regulator [Bacteroidota bacterium]